MLDACGVPDIEFMSDAAFHHLAPYRLGDRPRQPMPLGFGLYVSEHLVDPCFVSHHVAARFNTGCGVHIALAAGDEFNQKAVNFINAGADVEHRLTGVWIEGFEALTRRLLDTVKIFHGVTVGSPASRVQGAQGRSPAPQTCERWDRRPLAPIWCSILTTR